MLPSAIRVARVAGAPEATFSELQQFWRWGSDGPRLGRRKRAELLPLGLEPPTVVGRVRSSDGATKLLLSYGADCVEAVHIPRQVSTERVTVCLSSQVGCRMACRFCATGQRGLVRQLTAGEIVAGLQVILQLLGPRHPSDLSLVFMGMGEPLDNLSSVLAAVEVLAHPAGLGLSPRRITLSTSGLIAGITQLASAPQRPHLAVSLNATTDELRRQLMPVASRHSLSQLRQTLTEYPLRTGERIMVEYLLLAGVNDSPGDAQRLADYVASFHHHLNLVPFNEVPELPFRRPSEESIDAFAREILVHRPTVITVRRSRGRDVAAACGQLALPA